MTAKEAIAVINSVKFILDNEHYSDDVENALDMAIEALKAQEKTDLISRQDALDVLDEFQESVENGTPCYAKARAQMCNILPIQPEKRTEERTETHACDLINRQALMKEFSDFVRASNNSDFAQTPTWNDTVSLVGSMPSAQPEIIRCKDCKYAHITIHGEVKYCDEWFPDESHYIDTDNYCSFAERKTDE